VPLYVSKNPGMKRYPNSIPFEIYAFQELFQPTISGRNQKKVTYQPLVLENPIIPFWGFRAIISQIFLFWLPCLQIFPGPEDFDPAGGFSEVSSEMSDIADQKVIFFDQGPQIRIMLR
jgi:hypothetical protein